MRCAAELLALSSLLRYARGMSTAEYVAEVVYGRMDDQTLSFKLGEGVLVLAVVPHPMGQDPETLGYPRPRRVAQPDGARAAADRRSSKAPRSSCTETSRRSSAAGRIAEIDASPAAPRTTARTRVGGCSAGFLATRIAHRTLNHSFPPWSRHTVLPPNFRVLIAAVISLRACAASSADCSARAIQSSTS